mgnify:CR=1 FL=1
MRFFISGELDSEIDSVFRPIRQEIEVRLNKELGGTSYGNSIEEIFLAPIILGPRFSTRAERKLLKHKNKVADYRLVIDFEAFLNGTEQARKQLLLGNVLASVADISRKLGGKFEGEQLSQDIIALFEIQG